MSMNTPNANENENLKQNACLMPYKYETEHTYMEFIFIWAAAPTQDGSWSAPATCTIGQRQQHRNAQQHLSSTRLRTNT